MELFILIGGCYALYTVGMAIATTIDYYTYNKDNQLVKTARQRQLEKWHIITPFVRVGYYNKYIGQSSTWEEYNTPTANVSP